jgi:glycine betaine transporter
LRIPNNNIVAIIIIAIITLIFIIATVTGLEKGIKFIGNMNVNLSLILLLLMIIVGPTVFIFKYLIEGIGQYLQNIFEMSFFTSSVGDSPWPGWWTVFYWAWWISWTPFVGGFIALISRGRTIREFVIATLFGPAILSFIWIAAMGGSAIWLERFGTGGVVEPVQNDIASAFFVTLGKFPMGGLMSVIAVVLVATYFITSANSATFVMGMLTSYGTLDPSRKVKITWGVFEGLIASILLLAGGLSALQTAAIASAFPFMFFMCLSIFAFFKVLRKDYDLLQQGEFIGVIDLEDKD